MFRMMEKKFRKLVFLQQEGDRHRQKGVSHVSSISVHETRRPCLLSNFAFGERKKAEPSA